MEVKTNIELAGFFKLKISGGERGEIETGWFPNLLLDAGLSYYISTTQSSNEIAFCQVGASSTPVSATDTSLVSPVALSPLLRGSGVFTKGVDYTATTKTFVFPRGAAAGNLSEVCVRFANSNNAATALLNRALILDAIGNPTTITVLSDEVLSVTFQLRRWWSVPEPHELEYMDDGVLKTTTVSYNTNPFPYQLNSDFFGTFDGVLTGDGMSAIKTLTFSESQGNPSIGTAQLLGRTSSLFVTIANHITFTPPIPKTNEFIVRITQLFSVARRGE